MITTLKLRNFKSIQGDEIKLKPLTILAGPNSSGKSNIIESIAIISQIAKMALEHQLTLSESLEYETAEFYKYPRPSIEYLVYKGEIEREIAIEVQILSELSKRTIGYSIRHTIDPLKTEQTVFLNKNPIFHVSFTQSQGSGTSTFKLPLIWKGEQTKSFSNYLLRPDCFVPAKETEDKHKKKLDLRLRRIAESLIGELVRELGRTYLISAPRGIVPIETATGPDPKWVGKYGQNLIYILSKIYGQSKYKSIQKRISDWSERFGIGHIAAGLKKGSILGADFEDPRLRKIFDMASASYGSRQLLTIITQIFWSSSGDTLLIEEPEISLHPESQVLILELLAEAASEGKQIICTTHSPFFILSLSNVIGKQKLSKTDVAVYHVEKGEEGTRTRQLELSDRGFIKGWIPSYINVENKLFDDWAEKLD